MAAVSSITGLPLTRTVHRMRSDMRHTFAHLTGSIRGIASAVVFFLKVFPMLPSQPVDWVTKQPVVERVKYPTRHGLAEGDLYRPASSGPHPGIVVCLGVVPFGVEHPQVPVLGRALARAGFAALLYWSPAMRDFRLDPADIDSIALAYNWLIEQPFVDPARSGLLGTCVGGSFALMAAASPLIRDRVAFLSAYAPFSSMWTFAQDIASATRKIDAKREQWQVDPLTQKVFIHSLTASLEPGEAQHLRSAYAHECSKRDGRNLSADSLAVTSVLAAHSFADAERGLRRLPDRMRRDLAVMSPLYYVRDIRAPLVVLLHDRGDPVIPVSESRRLVSAMNGRSGLRYTEMQFHHLDPVKGKLPLTRLVEELGKFFRAVYPIFRQAA